MINDAGNEASEDGGGTVVLSLNRLTTSTPLELKRMLRRLCAVALVASFHLAAVLALAQQQAQTSEATGRLNGIVVDWNYARVVDSCLTVRSKTHQQQLKVNEQGAFDVELPAGTYEVAALSPNFDRVRIKNVRIEAGATRTQNFMLPVAKEISGQCPANTVRRGDLCESLCETSLVKDANRKR